MWCGLTLVNSQVLELLVFQVFSNDSQIWVRLCLNLPINHIWWGSYLAFGRTSVHYYLNVFWSDHICVTLFQIYMWSLVSLSLRWTPNYWSLCFRKTKVGIKKCFIGQEWQVFLLFLCWLSAAAVHTHTPVPLNPPLFWSFLSLCESLSQDGLLGGLEMARVRN